MKCNLAERSHWRLYALFFCREIVKIIIVIITCVRRRGVAAAENNREQMQVQNSNRRYYRRTLKAERPSNEAGSVNNFKKLGRREGRR